MMVTVIPIIIGALGRIGKETGRVGNRRTSRDYPNYSNVKISQNTELSPEDLKYLLFLRLL